MENGEHIHTMDAHPLCEHDSSELQGTETSDTSRLSYGRRGNSKDR